jgi:hypothetical protein
MSTAGLGGLAAKSKEFGFRGSAPINPEEFDL